MKKIAMIGVGKLGQACAEVMHEQYDVVGYDVNPCSTTFPMCSSIEDAVKDRDLIFVAVPTQHDPAYGGDIPSSHLPSKDFDYTIAMNVLTEINKYVNQNQLVVLISTVLPGTTRSMLRSCITNARFIYNPYLIAMGTVKWDMVNPEMVIIGTKDGDLTGDAKELIEFYRPLMQNDPRYEVGTWDEAESIKIFYNTFISTKITLVNMIQDVAERNGNINVDVVSSALAKSTHRIISPMYMSAGMGDGGGCHPRDNIALRYLSERLDLGYDLFGTIMRAREVQAENLALRCLKNGKNITIIGKAFKPGVPYMDGSPSMLVGSYITKHGGNLHYYDPNTGDLDLRGDWTHVYLIGYWDKTYTQYITFNNAGAVVIDPWRRMSEDRHGGEIIHYGNTRPKYNFTHDNQGFMSMAVVVEGLFPELRPHLDKIQIIDAQLTSETSFIKRPTELIVQHMIDAKQSGKTKFLFYTGHEGVVKWVINKIQRIAEVLDGIIDEKDIFHVTGAIDGKEVYDKLHKKYLWNKKINILSSCGCELSMRKSANIIDFTAGYEIREKEKKFLCFNKYPRYHRVVLLEKMLETGLIDLGFYSFNWGGRYEAIDEIEDKFVNITKNKHRFPMILNITKERSNPTDLIKEDIPYHQNSYFSVVTETLFYSCERNDVGGANKSYEDCLFPTEKISRCFAVLHPFVLFGRAGLLAALSKRGYKTFAPFIDESYDLIEDDDKRFDAVFSEIQRLLSFTTEEWITWQTSIKDIVEHNRNVLFDPQLRYTAEQTVLPLFNFDSP